MRASRDDPQFRLRLPPELKDWVEQQAERNYCSINAQVVLILAEAKERRDRAKARVKPAPEQPPD